MSKLNNLQKRVNINSPFINITYETVYSRNMCEDFLLNSFRKLLLLSISILFTIIASSQIVHAFDDGDFYPFGFSSIDHGFSGSGTTNSFTIIDSGLVGNGPDTLSVIVQSKTAGAAVIETLNLVLDETGDTGNFVVDHLVFMDQESEFAITDTALIMIEDQCDEIGEPGPGQNGNCDPIVVETLSGTLGDSVKIISDSITPGFIEIDLIETGPNTGIFTRQLSFCNIPGCSDATNAILQVSLGDVITVQDQHTFAKTNGLISGDPKRFAIIVEGGGVIEITATTSSIDAVTCSTLLNPGIWDTSAATCTVTDTLGLFTPGTWVGRGSGGLVRPGLVVDSSSGSPDSGNGSGCTDCTPPTLGINSNLKRIVTHGFSYNDNPVDVNLYYTPYPLVKVNVGQENKAVLKIYEDTGVQNIEHVGLGFGLGIGESFSDSKATINLDRTLDGFEIVSTYDPDNVFDNIKIQSEIGRCDNSLQTQCMIFTIYHTFNSPLKFDMVATYVWDFSGNAWQNYYNHGIHIVGDSLNPPKTKSVAFGTNEMRGLFTLTQVDIYEDKWIDEFGNLYIHQGNNRFDKIYSIPKEIIYDDITMHGCNRLCNWFESYKEHQEFLAQDTFKKILFGKQIPSEPKGFIPSPPYIKVSRAENVDLQNRITYEIKKAAELFEGTFDVKNNF